MYFFQLNYCIGLGNIFKNFLLEKKKITYFFDTFLYFHKNGINFFLKLFINKCTKSTR